MTPEIIDALVANVPFDGWTSTALRNALISLGEDPDNAPLIFPNGTPEMIEAFCTLADTRMIEEAANQNILSLRIPARVRKILEIRFSQNEANKTAITRALAWLALPQNLALSAKTLGRTVDSIWFAAGDTSADISWYTKRAILAGVYSSTLLFWLRDISENNTATLDFLDRRLAGVAKLGKLGKFRQKISVMPA
jgi:ubiquinone biosynthesis protein COQ9